MWTHPDFAATAANRSATNVRAIFAARCIVKIAWPVRSPATSIGGAPPPKTNTAVAALLGLIPGLGAVYNGDYTRALIHVAIWAGLLAVGLTEAFGNITPLAWIAFGLFPVYTSIDSYRAAQNRQLALTGAEVAGAPAGTSRPVGAFILIGLGVLALLGNMGLINGDWVNRGWPVVLIAIGIWLFMKRSRA